MKRAVVVSMLFLIGCAKASAAEADHYTSGKPLEDSATRLNEMANDYIGKAIEDLNRSDQCDGSVESETRLYSELSKYFANHANGELVIRILKEKDTGIDTRPISVRESIYADWSVSDGLLLGRPGAGESQLGLSPLMRVGETEIGVDKLEHMFGMGLTYFKYHYFKGDTVLDVLKHGIFREMTVLGGNVLATGVFSYGDLSANFNGMRFWNHILQKRDDVLGKQMNIGPYVRCEGGRWRTTGTAVDFRHYIDPSMDESINCRKFASRGGYEKSIRAMRSRGLSPAACPLKRELTREMYRKYNLTLENDAQKRPISHWIINLDGHGVVDYRNEFVTKEVPAEFQSK